MNEILDRIVGPQVAIIDNNPAEIKSIEVMLNEMKIGNQLFEVDYLEPDFPKQPLSTVQLVFLDLYYNNASHDFDPYACTDWLKAVVPANQNYILIIWSNDPHKADELFEVMKETETPIPYFMELKAKNEYLNGDQTYDIARLLGDLNDELKEHITISTQEYFGQVIAVEKNAVLVNCLIHEDPPTFEVRRFDTKPFQVELAPKKDMFLKIRITNRPGNKSFDFIPEHGDLTQKFKKPDDFQDLGDLSFLTDEKEDGDEDNV